MRQPDDTDEFIFWLFQNRCVGLDDVCYKWARDISHIIPKSSGKIADDWRNKVLHCLSCHSEYHRRGTSEEAIQKMQQRRAEHLEMIGKEEYI